MQMILPAVWMEGEWRVLSLESKAGDDPYRRIERYENHLSADRAVGDGSVRRVGRPANSDIFCDAEYIVAAGRPDGGGGGGGRYQAGVARPIPYAAFRDRGQLHQI